MRRWVAFPAAPRAACRLRVLRAQRAHFHRRRRRRRRNLINGVQARRRRDCCADDCRVRWPGAPPPPDATAPPLWIFSGQLRRPVPEHGCTAECTGWCRHTSMCHCSNVYALLYGRTDLGRAQQHHRRRLCDYAQRRWLSGTLSALAHLSLLKMCSSHTVPRRRHEEPAAWPRCARCPRLVQS